MHILTKMLSSNVLQASRAHRTSAQHHLTCPGIERLQQLDDPTHRVRRQHWQIHDDLQVVHKQEKHFQRGGYSKIAPVFDLEMLPGVTRSLPRLWRAVDRKAVGIW